MWEILKNNVFVYVILMKFVILSAKICQIFNKKIMKRKNTAFTSCVLNFCMFWGSWQRSPCALQWVNPRSGPHSQNAGPSYGLIILGPTFWKCTHTHTHISPLPKPCYTLHLVVYFWLGLSWLFDSKSRV
jgi:hypothetical protein